MAYALDFQRSKVNLQMIFRSIRNQSSTNSAACQEVKKSEKFKWLGWFRDSLFMYLYLTLYARVFKTEYKKQGYSFKIAVRGFKTQITRGYKKVNILKFNN